MNYHFNCNHSFIKKKRLRDDDDVNKQEQPPPAAGPLGEDLEDNDSQSMSDGGKSSTSTVVFIADSTLLALQQPAEHFIKANALDDITRADNYPDFDHPLSHNISRDRAALIQSIGDIDQLKCKISTLSSTTVREKRVLLPLVDDLFPHGKRNGDEAREAIGKLSFCVVKKAMTLLSMSANIADRYVLLIGHNKYDYCLQDNKVQSLLNEMGVQSGSPYEDTLYHELRCFARNVDFIVHFLGLKPYRNQDRILHLATQLTHHPDPASCDYKYSCSGGSPGKLIQIRILIQELISNNKRLYRIKSTDYQQLSKVLSEN